MPKGIIANTIHHSYRWKQYPEFNNKHDDNAIPVQVQNT